MNGNIKHATAPVGSHSASTGSNTDTRLPSASPGPCGRGNFSSQSHVRSRSPCSHRVSRSNFSSGSCSGGFAGGSYGQRSYPASSSQVGYGDGLVDVGGGIVGNVIGGIGGEGGTCRVIFSSVDGRTVMQNLNNRLAGYMENVQRLEVKNAELKTKIQDFIAQNGPQDYSHYYQQIEELKKQLICLAAGNNKILLKTDNHQMNVEDLKQKLWTEYGLRQNVEADINGLYPILDHLISCKSGLEAEFASLQQEICSLKKSHKERLKSLATLVSEIDAKVSFRPGSDLKKVLEDMRCKYEAMINLNLKEVAKWYEHKLQEVKQEVCTSCQEVENGKQKVIDLRCQIQGLEIELQTQCGWRDTIQASLAETECHYNAQLEEIQGQIVCMEQQLAELHLEMEDQSEEYKELLNVKNQLEQEITTYRHLLEGGQQDHVSVNGKEEPKLLRR